MPDQSLYPDSEETGASENAAPETNPKPDEKPDEQTALLPKSIFPGGKVPEVGEKCEFEIVHGYEDEVEVKYAKEGEPEEANQTAEQASPDMDNAMGKMASMAQ